LALRGFLCGLSACAPKLAHSRESEGGGSAFTVVVAIAA
jgi:hypothetical protein